MSPIVLVVDEFGRTSDRTLQTAGLNRASDQVVIRGDPDSRSARSVRIAGRAVCRPSDATSRLA